MFESEDKATILFVDDEGRIGRLLKMMFRADYNVRTALGAREALAILETTRVDVVISDQRMPETTGVQLLSRVRARWPETARILLTGYSDLVAIIGAVNEGEVHRFLCKPWNQDELRDTIAEAVDLSFSLRSVSQRIGRVWNGDGKNAPLSLASAILVADGDIAVRQYVRDMFSEAYEVVEASSVEETIERLTMAAPGVLVIDAGIGDADVVLLLEELAQIDPAVTTVATTSGPSSDAVIRLINSGRIFRLSIKPLSPNVFRSAVNSAMRDHHRRLADPRIVRRRMLNEQSPADLKLRLCNSVNRPAGL